MQKGFILIFVMILLGLAGLLLLIPWHLYLNHQKILNSKALETRLSLLMEADVLTLAKNPVASEGYLKHGSHRFFYKIIAKGTPPCLFIKESLKNYAVALWRIRIESKTRKITVYNATKANLAQSCPVEKIRFIKPGLQSWSHEVF